MKKIILILITSVSFLSCKKNQDTNSSSQNNNTSNLSIRFHHQIDGQDIEKNKLVYTNEAGNIYSVSLLKYYISDVLLINDLGEEFKLNNYDLINAFDTTGNFSSIEASNVPQGNYISMRFALGIDSIRNHTGAQDGDLDPIHDMIWTWNIGYLFMKHEGYFLNTNGDTTRLEYHLGTDLAYTNITVPIDLKINSQNKVLNINFNLNSMYKSPMVDFNAKPIMHSLDANDFSIIYALKINSQIAFSFGGTN
ncbi:MAG: hypothetical protein IT215_06900 [Chitinophagaceae bacterium]|nr:MAG: hypothetical protein UZ11_BCD004001100 [Bacteroidetes bacterium OLB11]MCC6448394.1 hypothetical protein [Chitinophagaceae bacterium]HMN33721.1 hypothetical protein [Chitinophagaceae bacterium]